jgi:hypothetical protein
MSIIVEKRRIPVDGAGTPGPPGPPGIQGEPGPNTVSTSTTTDITGILKGDGSTISAAVPGVDYVVPSTEIRLVRDGNFGRVEIYLEGEWRPCLIGSA